MGIREMRPFSFHLNYQGPNKIVVFHGWIVDGIKINGQLNGGNGGNKTVVHLQPGEKIHRIHGTRCRFENHTVVGQLTIVTTNGATYGPFGHNGDPHRHHHNHIVDSFNFHGQNGGHNHHHNRQHGTDINFGPIHIHMDGGHGRGHHGHGHNHGHGAIHNISGQDIHGR